MRIKDILNSARMLDEGKHYQLDKRDWVRIDQPTHGVGQTHAHAPGGVVNKDGTRSHKSEPFRLSKKAFDFLVAKEFQLNGRLVESEGSGDMICDLPAGAVTALQEATRPD
jgi:hypothetical protein